MRRISVEKFIFSALTLFILFSCKKDEGNTCPTSFKLSANNTKPIVGSRLALDAHLGSIIYSWAGPANFSIQKMDGSDNIVFENIQLKQSGWYYCGASIPGCNTLRDSIYIDVQYEQGTPSCSVTDNIITGTAIPTLQATNIIKRFDQSWQTKSLYASGSFGYPTYTVLFNSYNGDTEPKDGVYITSNVQAFDPLQDENIIFAQCQYNNYFFKTHANQKIFVTHINGKLRIAFCDLKFSGDNGNSVIVTSSSSGQITEK